VICALAGCRLLSKKGAQCSMVLLNLSSTLPSPGGCRVGGGNLMETHRAAAGEPENSGRGLTCRLAAGASGNSSGKPTGSRHRVTLLAKKLVQDDTEDVERAVLKAAKSGEMTAAGMAWAPQVA
jgi:hypothetical protein